MKYVTIIVINKEQFLDDEHSSKKIDLINTLAAYYLDKLTQLTSKE